MCESCKDIRRRFNFFAEELTDAHVSIIVQCKSCSHEKEFIYDQESFITHLLMSANPLQLLVDSPAFIQKPGLNVIQTALKTVASHD